jgi:hypothetical protein
MRKYMFKAGLVLVATLMFNGCAGLTLGKTVVPTTVQKDTGLYYEVLKTSDNDYLINTFVLDENGKATSENYQKYGKLKAGYSRKSAEAAQTKKVVYTALFKAAAEATRKLGYNYFVLTNVEVNGFSGFPINNFNDFMRYITLEDRKHTFDTLGEGVPDYRGLVNTHGETYLRFKPVSKSVYDSGRFAVWKISDFL